MKNLKFQLIFVFFVFLFFSCQENLKKDKEPIKEKTSTTTKPKSEAFILDSLIKNSPKNADLYFKRSQYYYKTDFQPKALVDILTAIKLDPTNASFYLFGSNIYMAMKQADDAIELLVDGISKNPKNEELFIRNVEYNYYVKDYKKALLFADELLRINKNNANAYFFKGMIFKSLDKTNKAISNFQTCVEQDPTYYNAYMQLGLLMSSKKDDLAINYFDNALKINANSREARYAKAYYYQQKKQYNKARAVYEEMIMKNKKDFQAFYNIGYCLAEQDSLLKAYKHFDIASNLKVDYVDAIFMKGQMSERMGDIKNAKIFYHVALKLLPDNEIIKESLANLSGK